MSHARIDSLRDRAEAIFRDLKFESVRKWKEETGGLAVGYMPIQIPREILHAQGVLPVGIMGGGEDVEIIKGDACYQSYICHIPRSTIEMGLNGSLDLLDGMIFPAICDVIRNLSGMWKLRFSAKLSRYLDVPHDFDPEVGGVFYRGELETLAQDLESRGAKPLEPEALRASIALFNRSRELVAALYDLRSESPWKVPSWELYLFLRAAIVLPVEEGNRLLEDYLEAAREETTRQPMDQARVILAGSFCEQPPLGLIRTLERSGCYIVDDDLVQVHRWFKGPISTEGDPMDALVNAYLSDSIESPTRYVEGNDKGQELVSRVAERRAEGVLFCAPSFCDPALLDQPMVTAAIDQAKIAWTAFKYSENNGQFHVIREQAGTFADSIKLWSGVEA